MGRWSGVSLGRGSSLGRDSSCIGKKWFWEDRWKMKSYPQFEKSLGEWDAGIGGEGGGSETTAMDGRLDLSPCHYLPGTSQNGTNLPNPNRVRGTGLSVCSPYTAGKSGSDVKNQRPWTLQDLSAPSKVVHQPDEDDELLFPELEDDMILEGVGVEGPPTTADRRRPARRTRAV